MYVMSQLTRKGSPDESQKPPLLAGQVTVPQSGLLVEVGAEFVPLGTAVPVLVGVAIVSDSLMQPDANSGPSHSSKV